RWAAGLGSLDERLGPNEYIIGTPSGKAKVRFTIHNDYGVIDHSITFEDGREIYVPMRVFPNGDGAEVAFTLFQTEGMDEARYAEDAAAV
ncbi:hypothetical protein, partial [Staphylococcus aureus]